MEQESVNQIFGTHNYNKFLIFPAKEFDAAKYFNTHPSLVNRTYNRPTTEMLKKGFHNDNMDEATLQVRFFKNTIRRDITRAVALPKNP